MQACKYVLRVGLLAGALLLAACTQTTPLPTAAPANTAAAPATPSPAARISVPTPSPTASAMPTTTATPSPALTATATPWPTATALVLPAPLTPAVPGDGQYRLRPWTANDADQVVGQIHGWLAAIASQDQYQGMYGFASYQSQFAIANRAEAEAPMRFPGAPQVNEWKWERAHDMAVANGSSSTVTQYYAQLMMEALNAGQISPETLPAWFASHEAEIAVTVTLLPPPNGYRASYMAEAVSPTCAACKLGAHWWIVQKDSQYTVFGLKSNLYWYTESGGSFRAIDLTGDGYPELVLDYGQAYAMGFSTSHDIYDLSQVPPQSLKIVDPYGAPVTLGTDGDSSLAARDAATDGPGFVYTETAMVDVFYYCRPVAVRTFRWTGERFVETQTTYAIDQSSGNLEQPGCQFIKDKVTTSDEIGALFAQLTTDRDVKTAEQKQDQILYHLAEFEARTGQTEAALALFQQEADHPYATADNPYPPAAKVFLQNYHSAADFYSTCLKASLCGQDAALAQLARGLYASTYPQSLDALQQAGVPLLASGKFDFSQSGSQEFWFTVACGCRAKSYLWVLAHGLSGAQALWVGGLSSPQPALGYWVGDGLPRVISLNGQTLFTIARTSSGDTAAVKYFYKGDISPATPRAAIDKVWGEVPGVADRLLAGGSPSEALADLGTLEPVLTRNCQYRPCDEFYYLVGLANELAGNERAAVAAYLKLWKAYPDSPYTIMAREKLELAAP